MNVYRKFTQFILVFTLLSSCSAQSDPDVELLMELNTNTIFQDSKGVLWFGTTAEGIAKRENDEFTYYDKPEIIGGKNVYDIAEDSKENLWFATSKGLTKYDRSDFTIFDTSHNLPSNEINCLTIDSKKTLWIGTKEGISRLIDGKFYNFQLPITNAEASKSVHSILEDKSGNYWFGTDNGIVKYSARTEDSPNGKFEILDENSGLTHNTVLDIEQDNEGNLWIATEQKGVCKYADGEFTQISTPFDERTPTAWGFNKDPEGNIWFAINGDGIYKFDGKEVTSIFTPRHCISHTVVCSFIDNEGRMWLGGWMGIHREND